MNGWLLAASGFALFGAVGHSWIGERGFLAPYLRSGIVAATDADLSAGMLRGAWHVWSLAYALSAVLLGVFAFRALDDGARIALWGVAGMFAAAFTVVLGVTRGRMVGAVLMGAIALLTAAGLRFA